MRRIIKQGLVVALALGTLGSTAWAHDPSRWENFCYAMQEEVDPNIIKQAPPPDVTPFQEAQPIAPMTQIFCGIRIVDSAIYCNAMIGLPTGVHRHIARTAAKQQGWRKLGDTTYMALF